MNRKQLLYIIVAVIVLGGAGLLVRQQSTASYRTTQGRMGQKALGDFDLNGVAQVSIQGATNRISLYRTNETWLVRERDYRASFSEISDLIRKLWELKVVQPVNVGASQLPRLELIPPDKGEKAGTLVELRAEDGKVVRSVLLGKKHMRQAAAPSQFGGDEGWPDGRYVMVDGQTNSISLVSETFANVEPKPEQWLDKDFFKVEKLKSVVVTHPVATNSWKLARETETSEMKLQDPQGEEKLDASKASGAGSALSYPSFTDVAVDAKPESTGLDKGITAQLETWDGFSYTVKIGDKTGEDNYYLTVAISANLPKERTPGKDEKPEDKEKLDKEFKDKLEKWNEKLKTERRYENTVYLVSKWTVDPLLKTRHELMAEKKAEPTTEAPAASVPAEVIPAGGIPPLPSAPDGDQ